MLSNRLCVGGNILALVNFTDSLTFLITESSPEARSEHQLGRSKRDMGMNYKITMSVPSQ